MGSGAIVDTVLLKVVVMRFRYILDSLGLQLAEKLENLGGSPRLDSA